MRKILLVNQHTVPIFTDVVNAFAASDAEIILFTGHIEKGAHAVNSRVRVVRSIAYNRRSAFSRLLTWLLFTTHYTFYLLLTGRPHRVLVVTNPPLAPLVTSLIARLRKIPFYVLVYDLYPNAFVQAGLLKQSNTLYKWWQRLNPGMFSQAGAIFTLSDSMKTACGEYLLTSQDNIKVVHNWADARYIHPIEKSKNSFIKKHGLEGKRIVLYSGNMGLTHDLESLVHAANILRDDPQIVFILIGDGGKRRMLESLKEKLQLTNITFLPYQDDTNFPMAMAAADIGVVTLGVGAEGISVPSKTYINFAAGCALLAIAPEKSELSRLIQAHQAGVICEPGDPRKVANAIKNLISNSELLATLQKNALAASQSYTPQNAYRYVEEVMQA